MLEPARFAVCNKSRKIGISHTTSGIAVIWGALHGETTTIISRGDREAAEVLELAALHGSVLDAAGSHMAVVVNRNKHEIRFASGGRIIALPSTGGRSFTGNVFLDEFAYHAHDEDCWDAAVPVAMLGHRVRVVSTPNGSGNKFADVVADTTDGKFGNWVLHELPIDTAVAQGYPVDLEACRDLAGHDERIFDQMFRCRFLDANLQYIPSGLLKRAFDRYTEPVGGFTYGGLDIGETRDRTSLAIVNRNADERRLVHLESHKLTDDDLIDRLVSEALETYGCKRVAIDATGLGTFPAKRLSKRYGRRVEAVDFTPSVKEDLATGLHEVLRTEDLKLPSRYHPDDSDEDLIPKLRDGIYKIRRIVTAAGNVRFDAQRTAKGHADEAWALMLALHAASRMTAMTAALQRAKAN